MELRHLRYFCAIAEERHVTRAAERLNLAQPALTQQIRALEMELRTALLRRAGRGIELTEAGSAFWQEAKAILEHVRVATHLAQQTGRGLAGRLAIGLTETVSFAPPVTSLLRTARDRWPDVEMSFVQGRSDELTAALAERRLDVAFIRNPAPADPSLRWQPFLSEGFVVVVPEDHPLASLSTVPVARLSGAAVILPRGRPGDGVHQWLRAAFAKLKQPPRIVQETPEYVMAINLVAAGFGLTVVPSVLWGIRTDAVAYRTLTFRPALSTEIIVASRRDGVSATTANFLALAAAKAPGA